MSHSNDHSSLPHGPEQEKSALFASLVLQQSNMAMMLLGKIPHPESGKVVVDPNAARMFIDTLEMIEEKTQGNLSQEEIHLLQGTLTSLRMAFVEATPENPQHAPTNHPLK